jgi:outer membrane lipoprotein-sorting protein
MASALSQPGLARSARCLVAFLALLSSLASSAQAITNYYADNNYGDAGFDGLSAVITNGHGPKRYITDAITLAANGDQISVAPGFYQETSWNLDTKNLTLLLPGQIDIVFYDHGQLDTVGDGIPDWWRIKYFGGDGTTTNVQSRAWADPDGDGYDNWEEFTAVTGPTNLNSHPISMVLITSAWAVYFNTNVIHIAANLLSTNPAVNVQAAEYFLDVVTGPDGTGTHLSASNGVFGVSSVTAIGTRLRGTIPYGSRHVFYLHAQGSDGKWTPFKQVILNPTAMDVLNAVQTNYSQMGDVSYTVSVSYYINGQLQQSPLAFAVQQKGGYMSRQTESDNGLVTIMNATSTAYINGNGQIQGGFQVDSITNLSIGVISTNGAAYYWDVPGFTNDFPTATASLVTNSANGSATFSAVPADTNAISSANLVVDMSRGVPVQETYQGASGTIQTIQHGAPIMVGPNVWLPSSEQVTLTYPDGTTIQWQTTISNVTINQGIPDSLFSIPSGP